MQRLGFFGMYTSKLASRYATIRSLGTEKERRSRIVQELGIQPQQATEEEHE